VQSKAAKALVCGAVALGLTLLTGGNAKAETVITVNGETFFLSHLTAKCQAMTDDPAGQIACFNDLSHLLNEHGGSQEEIVPVGEALETFREVTQFFDGNSGLLIGGSDCKIHVLYFNNYFHISRRNVSTMDLFSVQFDASKFQVDKMVEVQGGEAPLMRGFMEAGTQATLRGGLALDSSRDKFPSKSPRASLDAYANEVTAALPAKAVTEFEFALVHPQKAEASADIRDALQTLVKACQA
jgi:hypothetical protein